MFLNSVLKKGRVVRCKQNIYDDQTEACPAVGHMPLMNLNLPLMKKDLMGK